MEMLFTVVFTYSEAGGVLITGYSPEAGARLPLVGEVVEIRSPQGERFRGRVWRASRNLSIPSPVAPRPIDRAVLFSPGEVPMRSWGRSQVWSVESLDRATVPIAGLPDS